MKELTASFTKEPLSVVVAYTRPLASVASSADDTPVMAKEVVVAFVAVALVMESPPTNVDDAAEKIMPEVVALVPVCGCVHASYAVRPVASVPQTRTPPGFAFTSQLAAESEETVSAEVEAVPVTARLVVVALLVVALRAVKFCSVVEPVRRMFENVWSALQVFASARSDDDAAVIVMEEPRLKVVPLIVPKEPETSVEATDVVAYTEPSAFVARSAEGVFVTAKLVAVAFVVVSPPLNAMSVVVALFGNGYAKVGRPSELVAVSV
jgi:hypothetical protein